MAQSFSSLVEERSSKKSSGTSWGLIAAGVVAGVSAAGLVGYFLLRKPASAPAPAAEKKASTENATEAEAEASASTSTSASCNDGCCSSPAATESDVTEVPDLPLETMIKIFEEITANMKVVMVKLAQIEQQIRQSVQAQGKQISDQEMSGYLMNQFKQSMEAVEKQVYTKFSTNEATVERIAKHFAEEPSFKKCVTELQSLFRIFTGQSGDVEVPAQFTLEVILDIMTETMESMTDTMEKLCKQLTEEGLTTGTPEFQQKLQTAYMKESQEVRTAVQKKHGISQVS